MNLTINHAKTGGLRHSIYSVTELELQPRALVGFLLVLRLQVPSADLTRGE